MSSFICACQNQSDLKPGRTIDPEDLSYKLTITEEFTPPESHMQYLIEDLDGLGTSLLLTVVNDIMKSTGQQNFVTVSDIYTTNVRFQESFKGPIHVNCFDIDSNGT